MRVLGEDPESTTSLPEDGTIVVSVRVTDKVTRLPVVGATVGLVATKAPGPFEVLERGKTNETGLASFPILRKAYESMAERLGPEMQLFWSVSATGYKDQRFQIPGKTLPKMMSVETERRDSSPQKAMFMSAGTDSFPYALISIVVLGLVLYLFTRSKA